MAKTPRKAIPQPSVTEDQRLLVIREAAKREWSISHFTRSAMVKLIQDSKEHFEVISQVVSRNIIVRDTIIIHNIYISPETRIELDRLRERIGLVLSKHITISAMVRAAIDYYPIED